MKAALKTFAVALVAVWVANNIPTIRQLVRPGDFNGPTL